MAKQKKTNVEKTEAALAKVSEQMIGEVKERVLRKRKAEAEVPKPSVTTTKRQKKSTDPVVVVKSEQMSEQIKSKPSLQHSIQKVNDSSEDITKAFLRTAKDELNQQAKKKPKSI